MGDRKGILLIEDDDDIRTALDDLLRDEGYPVVASPTGRQALDLLRAMHEPGLILLDLLLPGMNGWQFCDELQRDPRHRSIPVVTISAYGSGESAPGMVRERIDKPIDFERLLAVVSHYCGS